MNFYIADTHFNCCNKWENRTKETDALLKENWNKTVTNGDHVYILGDIGRFGSNAMTEELCQIISTLKGNKHLIIGNHDSLKDQRIKQLFVEVCDYKEVQDTALKKQYQVVLSHYPLLFWNKQHKGSIHLYGHVHESTEYYLYEQCMDIVNKHFKSIEEPIAYSYNVGAMMPYINYTPVTLEKLSAMS